MVEFCIKWNIFYIIFLRFHRFATSGFAVSWSAGVFAISSRSIWTTIHGSECLLVAIFSTDVSYLSSGFRQVRALCLSFHSKIIRFNFKTIIAHFSPYGSFCIETEVLLYEFYYYNKLRLHINVYTKLYRLH